MGKWLNKKGLRNCYLCKNIFSLNNTFFNRNKSNKSGFCFECKKCQSQRRKNKGIKIRFLILKRDNFTCQYCGRKAPEVILEIDHIIPKSKGGLKNLNNLKTACRDCNLGKKDITL